MSSDIIGISLSSCTSVILCRASDIADAHHLLDQLPQQARLQHTGIAGAGLLGRNVILKDEAIAPVISCEDFAVKPAPGSVSPD